MTRLSSGPQPCHLDLFEFAGEHLFYEAQMFVFSCAIQPSNPFEVNIRIEVVVLHLRNLIEFFYPGKTQPDDVLASQYVPDWDSKRPAITSLLKKARIRANKELHHLTTQRIAGTPDHKEWDFLPIRDDLHAVITTFVGCHPNMPAETITQLQKI